jgi:hypothetical protein
MDIIERLEKLVGVHIGDADIDDDLLDAILDIKLMNQEIVELKTNIKQLQEEIERLQMLSPYDERI